MILLLSYGNLGDGPGRKMGGGSSQIRRGIGSATKEKRNLLTPNIGMAKNLIQSVPRRKAKVRRKR